jgi:hypothetical protein
LAELCGARYNQQQTMKLRLLSDWGHVIAISVGGQDEYSMVSRASVVRSAAWIMAEVASTQPGFAQLRDVETCLP